MTTIIMRSKATGQTLYYPKKLNSAQKIVENIYTTKILSKQNKYIKRTQMKDIKFAN